MTTDSFTGRQAGGEGGEEGRRERGKEEWSERYVRRLSCEPKRTSMHHLSGG